MSQLESPTCNLEVEEILSHHEFSNREYSYTRYKIRFSQIYEIMCYSPILLSIQGKKKCTLCRYHSRSQTNPTISKSYCTWSSTTLEKIFMVLNAPWQEAQELETLVFYILETNRRIGSYQRLYESICHTQIACLKAGCRSEEWMLSLENLNLTSRTNIQESAKAINKRWEVKWETLGSQ